MTAPAVIPGVVDGTVTASTEPDGTVSLRITIGPHTDDCDYIELIITADHATRIATTLLSTANSAAPRPGPADTPGTTTAPCSVGVRLTTGAAGTTGALRR
ncbi:hypothetical protein [Streptomyces sp. NPDC002067]